MKEKMNKLMHYTWHYFWNVGVSYLVLLPFIAIILFLLRTKDLVIDLYDDVESSVVEQRYFNKKALSILKERFKDNT